MGDTIGTSYMEVPTVDSWPLLDFLPKSRTSTCLPSNLLFLSASSMQRPLLVSVEGPRVYYLHPVFSALGTAAAAVSARLLPRRDAIRHNQRGVVEVFSISCHPF